MNYANEPSQAALEQPSQDVYDVTVPQQTADDVTRLIERIFKKFRPVGCTTGCIVYTQFKVHHGARNRQTGTPQQHSGISAVNMSEGANYLRLISSIVA